MNRLANRRRFRPTMEALEARWCPTTAISPLQDGVVTITGDDNPNTVQIVQNDNQNTLLIVVTHSGELAARFPRRVQLVDGALAEK